MTPALSAVVEQTIRLQEQTNHFQLVSLILILVCDVLIVLSLLNIRKTMRINREWTANLQRWSNALRGASVDIHAKRQDPEEGLGPKDG